MWLPTSATRVLNTWWARATRSRITIAFLLFVLANYAAQTTLHAMLLSDYERDHKLVTSAIDAAGVQRGFAIFRNGVIEVCYGVPHARGTTCHTVYDQLVNTARANAPSVQCAEGLIWLENYLRTTKIEVIVILIFQGWLVVNSLVALLDESVPHLIVVLAAQVVNTGWTSYRLTDDTSTKRIYDEIIINRICGHFDILGRSWEHSDYYVALGFSIAALLGMSFFIFKLAKLYSMGTLSSVGSSPVINRLLKWRLWMRVFILFSVFFILTSAVVWFNERGSDMIAAYSTNTLHDVGFYSVVVILWPWMTLGTYSITLEKRFLFLIYAFLSICLLLISGLWFGSAVFRYEYEAWYFFTCVVTLADVLLVLTCIVSVVCRVNFGKGLAQFLDVERALRASGFAQDTFLCDPSRPSNGEPEPSFISNYPDSPLSSPVIDITHPNPNPVPNPVPYPVPPSKTSKLASKSVYSFGSAAGVYTAWLISQASGDQEKGRLQIANLKGDRLGSTVTISRESMRPHSVHSSSDDESDSGDEDNKRKPSKISKLP